MINSYYNDFLNLFNFEFILNIYNINNFFVDMSYVFNYPIFLLFGFFFFFTTLISLIFISYLGLYGVFWLNLISLFFLWISFIPYLNFIFKENNFYFISIGKWMYLSQNYKVSFDFLFDNISFSFSFLTLTIAIFVYVYTFSYFRYEPLVERLVLFLNSFIISMVFLVSSGNFIMLFLGWEMIGLTSFLLINFWSTRVGTLKAAFKAYSFNKVSDFFLFFAILLIFHLTFTLDIITFLTTVQLYTSHFIYIFNIKFNILEVISIFLLGSAFIKSAQFGAHIWLPDSMEAPVPASALIHSATLVSAGIYLLLRFNNLFDHSYYAYFLIALIGSFTALYGGLTSMFQSDVKRILAYSTISHCGFLMVMYTTGVLEYVVLYLYIHGFFKAATFLCVGNIIRFSRNIQDYKRMGFFYKFLPFEAFSCFICLINLGGLPLTLGFYSKHLLLLSLNNNYFMYYLVLVNCILAALTGLYYSSKLYYYVFFDFKKSKKIIYNQAQQNNLNSKFYSNTTLIANLSITGLVLTSYTIILYLFSLYIANIENYSDFSKGFINISNIFIFISQISYLNNLSLLNWVVILLAVTIVFSKWRFQSFNYIVFKNLYFILIFSFFVFSLSLINIFK